MKKTLEVTKKYLLIPVKNDVPTKKLFISFEGERIYEFDIPTAETEGAYTFDFQGGLTVDTWIGKEITLEGEFPEAFAEAVVQADEIPESGCKKPLVHFSPDTGWMNDPCGLLYDKGVYHLYFQHNPFSTQWGNMSWGHAVSKDLLHWEQKDEALWPDGDGPIFTGSAVINTQGLFNLPKDAQLYVYTSAGGYSEWSKENKFVQKLAWSVDEGKTLNKMDGCILDHMIGENRDVKVYWNEEKQNYFAIMFLDKNDYAILNSTDLTDWVITQKLTLPPAWECPDLVEVKTEDGGTKWVLWTADGYYFVGEFDGKEFTYEGSYKSAYCTMLPYAAQTFNGAERVISVPWLRSDNKGKVRRSAMGLPRQFTLVNVDGEYVLRMKPVDEFEAAKEQQAVFELTEAQKKAVYEQKEEAAVELVLYPEKDVSFAVDFYGTKISLENTVLKIQGIAARFSGVADAVAKLGDKECVTGEQQEGREQQLRQFPEKISLFSDGEILEVTVDDGLMADAYETVVDEKSGVITVEADGSVKAEVFAIR